VPWLLLSPMLLHSGCYLLEKLFVSFSERALRFQLQENVERALEVLLGLLQVLPTFLPGGSHGEVVVNPADVFT
jgi:hypothetical protein